MKKADAAASAFLTVQCSEEQHGFSPPGKAQFQLFFMIQIVVAVIVTGVDRALFDAGAALDADAGILPYVFRADGAHRADLGAEAAVIARVVHLGLVLQDIDRVSVAVLGHIVGPVGDLPLHRDGYVLPQGL